MSTSRQTDRFSLTQGGILNKILMVALPIMGTNLLQLTYNLADMFWLGRLLGGNAVAASGTAGMYMWLSVAFMMFGRMGAEIGVAQNLGHGDSEAALGYAQAGIFVAACLGCLYSLSLFFLRGPLIDLFNIQEQSVAGNAKLYLSIVSAGIPFDFLSMATVGIYNASGNSRLPFFFSIICVGLNIALDPILISVFHMGIAGAALATAISQFTGGLLSILALTVLRQRPFARFKPFCVPKPALLKQILRWATPVALENFLFTTLTMLISRLINGFGADAMAANRIGSQIESLTWLIGGGFSSALTAFAGQNFGAGKWSRLRRGFRISALAMLGYGSLVTLLLLTAGAPLYRLFLPDAPRVLEIGVTYLKILALCQLLSCLEGVAIGFSRGMGKTMIPSTVSIASSVFRTALAYALVNTSLGMEGIWWALTIGSALRGLWMLIWYLLRSRKTPREDALPATA
ncbi:MAG: MATE family efflux transporter [Christensenellaceae bacterium]|jgi:putative MATE family efflux protein|nr:MATE family efflux transporter [Christensenellaceae bacterium]